MSTNQICPNCGGNRVKKYCPDCGQRNIRKIDLSILSILSDLASQVFGSNSRFIRTIKDFINPGVYP